MYQMKIQMDGQHSLKTKLMSQAYYKFPLQNM
jgi:hypothetical protein